jgi:hypothetical protein
VDIDERAVEIEEDRLEFARCQQRSSLLLKSGRENYRISG